MPATQLPAGTVVERYEIDSLIGKGGMAVVYRVRHTRLGSFSALKVLSLSSDALKLRLEREGQAQSRLRHPHIVAVTDLVEVVGQPGLVMEYVDGPALDEWLATNTPDIPEAERLFRGIVAAVQHAHERGYLHRDLKPANVLLQPATGGFVPKVADFGLAKLLEETAGTPSHTRSGIAMGTPAYMPPEQIRDAASVDERADVFALGCILFELVCGRAAFVGADMLAIFNAVTSASYPPPTSLRPDLPRRLQDAINGCLATERDARIPSCAALLEVLDGRPLDEVLASPAPPVAPRPTVVPDTRSGAETWVESLESPSPVPDGEAPVAKPTRRRWLAGGLAAALVLVGIALVPIALVGGAVATRAVWSARVQRALDGATGGEITYAALAIRPGRIVLDDVVMRGHGRDVVSIDEVHLVGMGRAFGLLAGRLRAVEAHGVRVDIRHHEDHWDWPDATKAAVSGGRLEGVLPLDRVQITGLVAEIRDEAGRIVVSADALDVASPSIRFGDALGWSARRARATGLAVTAGDRVLSAGEVVLDDAATLSDVELVLRLQRDGRIEGPPVLADHLPMWLGGDRVAAESGWIAGFAELLPLVPPRLQVSSGRLLFVDRAHAARTVEWEVELDHLTVGPRAGDRVPVSVGGRVGEGAASLTADLSDDGMIRGRFEARYLPIARLDAYYTAEQSRAGVKLAEGVVDAAVDFSGKGDALAARLDAELRDVRMVKGPGGLAPGARPLLSSRARVVVVDDRAGSLADVDFAPVGAFLGAIGDALFAPARGRAAAVPRASAAASTEAPPAADDGGRPMPRPSGDTPDNPGRGTTEAPSPSDGRGVPKVPRRIEEAQDELDRWKKEVEDALDDLRRPRGGR